MEERNSERKSMWVTIALSVAVGLAAVADQLLGMGVLDKWPVVVAIVTALLGVASATGIYNLARPGKLGAVVAKQAVALEAAKSAKEPPAGG